MNIGLALPPDPAQAVAWAAQAERAGIGHLWMADDPTADALPTLAAVARVTTTPRLGVLDLDVVRRPPSLLAKGLATLDVLSHGRLAVRLKSLPDPRQLDEAITILVGLFTGGPFTFSGVHWSVQEARCLPLPVQRPHPPLRTGPAVIAAWPTDPTAMQQGVEDLILRARDAGDVSTIAAACNLA